jgi:hypothetical protein
MTEISSSRKIFRNVAKSNSLSPDGGLAQVYSESIVNSDKRQLISIRNLSLDASFEAGLMRVSEVFDIYSTSFVGRKLLEQNIFRIDGYISKNRSTTLYREFRSASYINILKNQPKNGTLVEIFPDSKNLPDLSLMLENSRSSPVVSGDRDVTRFANYLISSRGISFLARQQLLQSSNTFGQSRRYNALSVPNSILNYANSNLSTPLERISRVSPNNSVSNPQFWGRLQKETVLLSQSSLVGKYVGGAQRSTPDPLSTFVTSAVNNLFKRQSDRVNNALSGVIRRGVSWINSRVGPRFSIGETSTVGQVGRKIRTVVDSAEAFRRANRTSQDHTLEKDQTAYDALYEDGLWPLLKQNDGSITSFSGEKAAYIERARSSIQKLKGKSPTLNNINTFTRTSGEENFDDYRSGETYTDAVRSATGVSEVNGVFTARYIQDSFNFLNKSGTNLPVYRSYELEDEKFDQEKDFIKLMFRVPGVYDRGIKFRAMLEEVRHNNSARYNETFYVGRPERFITYSGASRTVDFTLYLVAFSEPEIHTIWTRANMLNKLTFPIKNDGGFMTPPITEITLGNVLYEQPGYVMDISTTFEKFPWDIDNELPMGIKLSIKFGIIEKNYVNQYEYDQSNPLLFNEIASGLPDTDIDRDSRTDEFFSNLSRIPFFPLLPGRRRFSTRFSDTFTP